MPMPAPPCASGTSRPMTPRSAEPGPDRGRSSPPSSSSGSRTYGEIGACSARKRRTVSREQLLVVRPFEVHGVDRALPAADVTWASGSDVALRPVRLQYGDAEEALPGASSSTGSTSNLPAARGAARSRSARAPTCPSGRATWQRTLFDAGWLVPGWPPELGGRNATPIAADDLLRGDVAARDPAQPQPAGPRDHRPVDPATTARPSSTSASSCPTLRAEIAWCLGMSEPGAGQRPREPARRVPCSTATTSSSTARRCGRRARTTPTGASASCAPIPTCRSTRASARSSST